jgi:hypothetical protein
VISSKLRQKLFVVCGTLALEIASLYNRPRQ